MEKSNLYTRTGDGGTTSLVGGERVKKNSLRLEAYGTIDELSSNLGMLISDTVCVAEVRDELHQVQNELFNIGGYLATAMPAGEERVCASLVGGEKIQSLEEWIDALVDPAVIGYVNRLSDYLFIAARYLNFIQGVEEIIWKK